MKQAIVRLLVKYGPALVGFLRRRREEVFHCPRRQNAHVAVVDRWVRGAFDIWPEAFERPRVCSFCASVHPDDALKLVQQGWRLHRTERFYRFQVDPEAYPSTGYVGDATSGRVVPSPRVVPPLMLNSQHTTAEFLRQLGPVLGYGDPEPIEALRPGTTS